MVCCAPHLPRCPVQSHCGQGVPRGNLYTVEVTHLEPTACDSFTLHTSTMLVHSFLMGGKIRLTSLSRGASHFLKKGLRKKLNPLAHSAITRRSFFPWQVVGHVGFHYDFKRNTSSKKTPYLSTNWQLSTKHLLLFLLH